MKKAEKQEYVREVVAVGVFVVALCAVCAFMNGTGYVPFSVVCYRRKIRSFEDIK